MPTESTTELEATVRAQQRKIEEYERWFRFLDQQNRRLERDHQKLSAIVHGSDVGIAIVDSSMNISWANEALRQPLRGGGAPGDRRRFAVLQGPLRAGGAVRELPRPGPLHHGRAGAP